MAKYQRSPRRPFGLKEGEPVAVLDIGDKKTICLIGSADQYSTGYSLLGWGQHRTLGIKAGEVSDMEGLERSVRVAVAEAERMAQETVDSVILGVSGSRITSQHVKETTETAESAVSSRDIKRVQRIALNRAGTRGSKILSAYPVTYALDDRLDVGEPLGMIGKKLTAKLNVLSAPKNFLANFFEVLSRAHLNIGGITSLAIASGAGTLVPDEREHGALCIDMGASVTTLSCYRKNVPTWMHVLSLGGNSVTADIASVLKTTTEAAERLKLKDGIAVVAAGQQGLVECAVLNDNGQLYARQIRRGEIAQIIQPRIEETFESILRILRSADLGVAYPSRIILTGGASQLAGVHEIAMKVMQMPVRLGRPLAATILGNAYSTPDYAAVSGLLAMCFEPNYDVTQSFKEEHQSDGFLGLGQIYRWLRENF